MRKARIPVALAGLTGLALAASLLAATQGSQAADPVVLPPVPVDPINQLDRPVTIPLSAAQVGHEDATISVDEPLHGYVTPRQTLSAAQQKKYPDAVALIVYRPDGVFPYAGTPGVDQIHYTGLHDTTTYQGRIDMTVHRGKPVEGKIPFWQEPHPGVANGTLILTKAADVAYRVEVNGVHKGTYQPSAFTTSQLRITVPGGSLVRVRPQEVSSDPTARLVGTTVHGHRYFQLMKVTGYTATSLVNRFRIANPSKFPVTVTHPGGTVELGAGKAVILPAPVENVPWAAVNETERFVLRDAGTIRTNQIRTSGTVGFDCDGELRNWARFTLNNQKSTEPVTFRAYLGSTYRSWRVPAKTTWVRNWPKAPPRRTYTLKSIERTIGTKTLDTGVSWARCAGR